MKELLAMYREAWRGAGHKGNGKVMLAFHMYCAPTKAEAVAIAREPLNRYLKSLTDAASAWTEGLNSKDYPGYDKIIAGLRAETFESQVEKGAAWVGTPDEIAKQIDGYIELTGGFESASLQINFNTITQQEAERSMRLFGETVIPRFANAGQPARAKVG
jgi:alkanesulfonate monooxygenase SsuD/methylene tetrahydromethanopterin reductase-like flavin-dependent oxidoreductase (luciferase family)